MDVYTYFQHIYVQTTWKVNLASDDPFKQDFQDKSSVHNDQKFDLTYSELSYNFKWLGI